MSESTCETCIHLSSRAGIPFCKEDRLPVRPFMTCSKHKPLTVQAAAIIGDDGKVYSEPRPARHHDVIATMRMNGYGGSVAGIRQGFLLSDGRFATRDAARIIAEDSGQILPGRTKANILTSEDMW